MALPRAVKELLDQQAVTEDLADSLSRSGHQKEQFRRDFLDRKTDPAWRHHSTGWVFDDFTRLFRAAGFTRGLFLVDEAERIVVHQNLLERQAFVEDVRYCFLDGPHESTRTSLYALLLTIHPYVQELLQKHWFSAGMDRFASLSGELAPEHTIYFKPFDRQAAVRLVTAYLDESRISQQDCGQLKPFEQSAPPEALHLVGGLPGALLALLHRVTERAMREEWSRISPDNIKEVFELEAPSEPEERAEEHQLPRPRVDLRAEDE